MRHLLALLVLSACTKNISAKPVERRALRLLTATPERETACIPHVAITLEADTDQERTPRVVAVGDSPLISAEGADVWLAGDEAGTAGFEVDNAILLEVYGDDGKRVSRAAVGYLNGLSDGKESIDLLSRRAFRFEANEVNLRALLPESGYFRIHASVLDTGGVGRVSDVFLVITPRSAKESDGLRDQE